MVVSAVGSSERRQKLLNFLRTASSDRLRALYQDIAEMTACRAEAAVQSELAARLEAEERRLARIEAAVSSST